MVKEKILVVDDEQDIIELIKYNLEMGGFRVSSAYNGEDALRLAKREPPDLLILDLMLPGMDGLEVCQVLKKESQTSHIPIIMLTAKTGEPDIVVGLGLGADDYITKPFSTRELIARVKAVLRRVKPGSPKEKLVLSDLIVDSSNYRATVRGNPIDLTHTEFNLLLFLVQRQGRVMTRQQILDGVLGDDAFVTDRTVDVHIRRLRMKLKEASSYIVTRRGIGYMFQPTPSEEAS
ncbi:MAG: response regulator transcription factor [Desulfobacterales bacterium]|nr:response regulator transcription factor [Desulfobacterales bacterium]